MRAYLYDVASSYHRRPATPSEVETALVEHPGDDLVRPQGVFLVATTHAEVVCGCVGLARVDPASARSAGCTSSAAFADSDLVGG